MAYFKDKVVLITGASSGIGADTAVEFAKNGARLGLTGRNEENLKKTAKRCEDVGLPQDKIFLVTGELTIEADVNKVVDSVVQKFGSLDVLVNNAGAAVRVNFQNTTVQQFQSMMDVNVLSVFMMTRQALPHLIKTKGSVVNVSSLSGYRPVPQSFGYSVAKAAVNQMTQALAVEVAPQGVRVNAVCPGFILTDIFTRPGGPIDGQPERLGEFMEKIGKVTPFGRIGHTEEVTKVILFLASDAASYMTGACLPIDGGRHAVCPTPT